MPHEYLTPQGELLLWLEITLGFLLAVSLPAVAERLARRAERRERRDRFTQPAPALTTGLAGTGC